MGIVHPVLGATAIHGRYVPKLSPPTTKPLAHWKPDKKSVADFVGSVKNSAMQKTTIIKALQKKIAELEALVVQQSAKIAELEKRLNKNSHNSS